MATVTAYTCDGCNKHLETGKGFGLSTPISVLGVEGPPIEAGHYCGECLYKVLARWAKTHGFRFIPPAPTPRGGPGDR